MGNMIPHGSRIHECEPGCPEYVWPRKCWSPACPGRHYPFAGVHGDLYGYTWGGAMRAARIMAKGLGKRVEVRRHIGVFTVPVWLIQVKR